MPALDPWLCSTQAQWRALEFCRGASEQGRLLLMTWLVEERLLMLAAGSVHIRVGAAGCFGLHYRPSSPG